MDSTPVTKPNVHAEQFYSARKPNCGLVSYNCQRRKLRSSSISQTLDRDRLWSLSTGFETETRFNALSGVERLNFYWTRNGNPCALGDPDLNEKTRLSMQSVWQRTDGRGFKSRRLHHTPKLEEKNPNFQQVKIPPYSNAWSMYRVSTALIRLRFFWSTAGHGPCRPLM